MPRIVNLGAMTEEEYNLPLSVLNNYTPETQKAIAAVTAANYTFPTAAPAGAGTLDQIGAFLQQHATAVIVAAGAAVGLLILRSQMR